MLTSSPSNASTVGIINMQTISSASTTRPFNRFTCTPSFTHFPSHSPHLPPPSPSPCACVCTRRQLSKSYMMRGRDTRCPDSDDGRHLEKVCQHCSYSLAHPHTQHTTRLPVVSTVHARFRVIPTSCCIHVVYTRLPCSTLNIHVQMNMLFPFTPTLGIQHLSHKNNTFSSLLLTQFAKLKFVEDPAVQSRIYTRDRNSLASHRPFPNQVHQNTLFQQLPPLHPPSSPTSLLIQPPLSPSHPYISHHQHVLCTLTLLSSPFPLHLVRNCHSFTITSPLFNKEGVTQLWQSHTSDRRCQFLTRWN